MNSLAARAKRLFLDSIKIKVQGGTGGHGLPQYGGIGGKGGDVYIKGSERVKSLRQTIKFSPERYFKAGDGESARRTRLLGESGKDLFIDVPLGITIQGFDKEILGEINESKDKVIVAMGGRGGDKYNDNQGFVGQSKYLILNLKMISDAALVGFPNAGKSSLLGAISNASPKIASYPFTTLTPNLGVIKFPDHRYITIADLPGLVEGAHQNIGLGFDFLKHVERARVLVFLIDLNDADLGPTYSSRSPLETLCILNKEIELYDDTILNKPAILALSKVDSRPDSDARFNEIKEQLLAAQKDMQSLESLVDENIRPRKIIRFDEILPLSSKTKTNIEEFKNVVRETIDKYAEIDKLKRDNFSTYRELQPMETNRIL